MKKKNTLMSSTKDLVGSGVMLGVGSTTLGAMGQGALAKSIIEPGAGMLGVAGTTMFASQTLKYLPKSKKGGKYNV